MSARRTATLREPAHSPAVTRRLLRRLEAPGVYERLAKRSSALVEGLLAIAGELGIEMSGGSLGGMWGVYFHAGPVRNFDDAKASDQARFRRFFHAMLEGGVYLAPSAFEAGFVGLRHRARDIDQTLSAARNALLRARRAR